MPEPDKLPSAGVWRRLAAMFYDSLLLFSVLFVASLAAALVTGASGLSGAPAEGDVVRDISPSLSGWGYQLYLLAIAALFFCFFWRKNGQTLGMQAWRLRVQGENGAPPSWKQCLLRLAAALPSLLLAGAGYWWIWVDREGRAWHDRASGTWVVVLPKMQK